MENIQPILAFDESAAVDIAVRLRTLLATPAGSMVLDREFGIRADITDQSIPVMRGMLSVEIVEKTRRYVPEIIVQEIQHVGGDPMNGIDRVRVVVGLAG